MIATILEIVNGALKLVNGLISTFKRTVSQSIESAKAKLRKQKDDEKKGKRPKW